MGSKGEGGDIGQINLKNGIKRKVIRLLESKEDQESCQRREKEKTAKTPSWSPLGQKTEGKGLVTTNSKRIQTCGGETGSSSGFQTDRAMASSNECLHNLDFSNLRK